MPKEQSGTRALSWMNGAVPMSSLRLLQCRGACPVLRSSSLDTVDTRCMDCGRGYTISCRDITRLMCGSGRSGAPCMSILLLDTQTGQLLNALARYSPIAGVAYWVESAVNRESTYSQTPKETRMPGIGTLLGRTSNGQRSLLGVISQSTLVSVLLKCVRVLASTLLAGGVLHRACVKKSKVGGFKR